MTTLEARVAEAEAERDKATEEAEKFERASEALQDEIFNLDVEFEQSSQAMNEQFQSDLERKLDQVKQAEKEKGAVAKSVSGGQHASRINRGVRGFDETTVR